LFIDVGDSPRLLQQSNHGKSEKPFHPKGMGRSPQVGAIPSSIRGLTPVMKAPLPSRVPITFYSDSFGKAHGLRRAARELCAGIIG
jgi:hypothetical protein